MRLASEATIRTRRPFRVLADVGSIPRLPRPTNLCAAVHYSTVYTSLNILIRPGT